MSVFFTLHGELIAVNSSCALISRTCNFQYALREENRLLFNKMLSECKENGDCIIAAKSKALQQQKMVNELTAKLSERKERSAKITRWMDKDTG